MRLRRNVRFCTFILFGVLSILTNSCTKEDDPKPEEKITGTMTDIDGNVYNTITIGTQTWMMENLKTTKYRNGDPITNITDSLLWRDLISGAYCDYNNDVNNVKTYGRIYNWFAVTDSRNIAPTGWHIPTDEEWSKLTDFLGGIEVAGAKMKESTTNYWTAPNTGSTNESGFTALPAGNRHVDGTFVGIKTGGGWWSSTEDGTKIENAFDVWINNNKPKVNIVSATKQAGVSVRCIKD